MSNEIMLRDDNLTSTLAVLALLAVALRRWRAVAGRRVVVTSSVLRWWWWKLLVTSSGPVPANLTPATTATVASTAVSAPWWLAVARSL